jgi:Cu2+-exporting ATPase
MENADLPNALFSHREVKDTVQKNNHETGYQSLVTQKPEGLQNLTVLVSGVTCALCIQKIESALYSQPGVKAVQLNFAARRLSIEWNGSASRANDFVQVIEKLGYGVHPYDEKTAKEQSKSEERFLLLCLGVAGFAMGNIMLLSVGVWSTDAETMGMATRNLLHWISAMIALPAILFSGRPFFKSALKVLSKGHTNMDVPISLALILTSGASLFEAINHGEHVYFDSAIMLTFFLLIGRYLDFKARENARSSANDLLQSFQGFATVIDGDETKRVLIRDLKEGMIVSVATGEKFPVDGVVQDSSTTVDTSLITGETLPRDIASGDGVYAGTINLSEPVIMKVAKVAADSLLSDIVRLMDKAGQAQAAYVRIADKAAKLYTPVVHSMSLITFLGWFIFGATEWHDALLIAVTVLIITCPCALGLAVPVVQVLATGKLLKRGVFVKSGDALERLATIDTVIFDKTGTLTLGKPVLVGEYDAEYLKLAASVAIHSAHPLSKALTESYDGSYIKIDNIHEHQGLGLSGSYQGKSLKLGSRNFCDVKKAADLQKSEIWLQVENENPVPFHFEDDLRKDAKQVVRKMKEENIQTFLISGDHQNIAETIAEKSGIETVYGERTPVQKFEILEDLQLKGDKVLMVGDGLNDAPVIAKADISIAPGTAVDMTQNAADIVFMGDDLMPVYETYKTARFTQILVKQNFALAVIYNMIVIPLAVMGMVTPLIAALAMSGSSLIVIANSFRLKLTS